MTPPSRAAHRRGRCAGAQANLESARLNLGYASVIAPISGRARRAEVTEGALVSAGNGTLLTTIEQIDRVYVNFGQSSSDLMANRRDMGFGQGERCRSSTASKYS
jgi:membrane fusion protein (multidrug efflux system)